MHHAEKLAPRPDGLANLVRHDSGNLVKMRQVVRGPRRQQLP